MEVLLMAAAPGGCRCGGPRGWVACAECGGAGLFYRFAPDPLGAGGEDLEECPFCDGRGGQVRCLGCPQ